MTSTLLILAIAFSQPNTAQSPPEAFLASLASKASDFWDSFTTYTCVENLDQRQLDAKGKSIYSRRTGFDYLILLQMQGDEPFIEESRIAQSNNRQQTARSLLATHGFSTMLLLFHPLYQSSFTFKDLGIQVEAGRLYRLLSFAHIPGQRSPSLIQLRTREYPVSWQGRAWIDVESLAVTRIEATMSNIPPDLGIENLHTDVRYSPVAISRKPQAVWLPKIATIELSTKRQRWVNTHEFVSYRQFQVDATSQAKDPVLSKPEPRQ